jgi:hypothetical protein
MSVPAAKALSPAPLRISTFRLRSSTAASHIAASRSYMPNVSEFLAFGRLKMMRPIPSRTS